MKIGYIASHIYRHTFEINEAAELLRQAPGTCVYSFYRATRADIQHDRARELEGQVRTWGAAGILGGLGYVARRRPGRLISAALILFARSLRNPVYCAKNAAAMLVALPILRDAHRAGVTHLHANFGSSPATIAWLGKHLFGVRMSIAFHAFDIYVDAGPANDPLRTWKLRQADLVVAAHEDGRRALMAMVPGEPASKFVVIYISVVFAALPRATSPETPSLVIGAGNLVGQKGFDVLIRAVGDLAERGVPVRCRILGEGEARAELEALARSLGVADRVEMPGYYQHYDLATHLAEATAFAMPSKVVAAGFRDGIPTVMVEAWLADTPVVASPVAGMTEVLRDGENALVFEPGDHRALAACVARLIESPELGARLAARGKETATELFSPATNVRRLLDAIRAVA